MNKAILASLTMSVALLLSVCSMDANASSEVTLVDEFNYQGQQVVLDMDVGRAELIASDDEQVRVEVSVKASDTNWLSFWSNKDVTTVTLAVVDSSDKLVLKLSEQDDLNQDWRIYLPRHAKLKVDAGVGEVIVDGLSASIDIDLGVGRTEIKHQAQYGEMTLKSGVGEVSISENGKALAVDRNLVSQSFHKQQSGSDEQLYVSVGVGEISVNN
ncbi:hypothetical protein [Shewanella sp. Isolate11]|uniref:hypothetical protein n=1 Tax=Shewanella sp. Isolate11 TaxID=2908530 RepID=UPI001EFCC5C3|nr:hypothetical protein [Shewanella sp. Isolate11]MCG9697355.1 hypothetical protein [Shewanella sp. Isolate11]